MVVIQWECQTGRGHKTWSTNQTHLCARGYKFTLPYSALRRRSESRDLDAIRLSQCAGTWSEKSLSFARWVIQFHMLQKIWLVAMLSTNGYAKFKPEQWRDSFSVVFYNHLSGWLWFRILNGGNVELLSFNLVMWFAKDRDVLSPQTDACYMQATASCKYKDPVCGWTHVGSLPLTGLIAKHWIHQNSPELSLRIVYGVKTWIRFEKCIS